LVPRAEWIFPVSLCNHFFKCAYFFLVIGIISPRTRYLFRLLILYHKFTIVRTRVKLFSEDVVSSHFRLKNRPIFSLYLCFSCLVLADIGSCRFVLEWTLKVSVYEHGFLFGLRSKRNLTLTLVSVQRVCTPLLFRIQIIVGWSWYIFLKFEQFSFRPGTKICSDFLLCISHN
jgi:hypothetical protein